MKLEIFKSDLFNYLKCEKFNCLFFSNEEDKENYNYAVSLLKSVGKSMLNINNDDVRISSIASGVLDITTPFEIVETVSDVIHHGNDIIAEETITVKKIDNPIILRIDVPTIESTLKSMFYDVNTLCEYKSGKIDRDTACDELYDTTVFDDEDGNCKTMDDNLNGALQMAYADVDGIFNIIKNGNWQKLLSDLPRKKDGSLYSGRVTSLFVTGFWRRMDMEAYGYRVKEVRIKNLNSFEAELTIVSLVEGW